MTGINPLQVEVLFSIGPVPISRDVVTTWIIMAVLVIGAWLGLRRATVEAGTAQTALEIVVETIVRQIGDITASATNRFLPLLGTLFIFLAVANVAAILPGTTPPTGHIETPAALALTVFVSVHYFGIRARGLVGYLKHYTRPSPFLLPLNVLAEFTRTFSLMVRLFGNMMSHEIVIAIILVLAGLLLPVPFLLLGILIGLIQAYIFTVLAAMYIGAASETITLE